MASSTVSRFPWQGVPHSGGSPASAFWLDPSYLAPAESQDEHLLRLASIRRGVAQFVGMLTGADIPVKYSSGKQSYATHDHASSQPVVIISANDDPAMLDHQVGLALHEGAHLILSKKTKWPESIPLFYFLKKLNEQPEKFVGWFKDDIERLGMAYDQAGKLMRTILNIMEDRRIDSWMYERAPGYQAYYHALYEKKWLSPRVSHLLMNPTSHVPTVANYRFHVVNMINPASNPDVLPGLHDIWDIIDIPNIRRFGHDIQWDMHVLEDALERNDVNALPDMVLAAMNITSIILKNAVLPPKKERSEEEKGNDQDAEGSSELDGDPFDQPEDGADDLNYDLPDDDQSMSDDDVRRDIQQINDDIEKELDGEYTPENELTTKEQEELDGLEEAGASLTRLKGEFNNHLKVLVYHRVTRRVVFTESFPFTNRLSTGGVVKYRESVAGIEKGIRRGQQLANRLQILADESPLAVIRQKAGKLNRRTVADLGFESETVFETQTVERKKPVLVHLTIDASGSMKVNWSETMALAVSLARAATLIPTLDVVIDLRGTTLGDYRSNTLPCVAVIFDSRRDKFEKIHDVFPWLAPLSATPEGLCFHAIKDIITSKGSPDQRRYFVNISDGMPQYQWRSADGQYHSYNGDPAYQHTAKQVRDIRGAGIRVLSYFIAPRLEGDSLARLSKSLQYRKLDLEAAKVGFRKMYGPDARFIDLSNVTQIATTLNRLFLSDDS